MKIDIVIASFALLLASIVAAQSCGAGFYLDAGTCVGCPLNSISLAGSTSINDCACRDGYGGFPCAIVSPWTISTSLPGTNTGRTMAIDGTGNICLAPFGGTANPFTLYARNASGNGAVEGMNIVNTYSTQNSYLAKFYPNSSYAWAVTIYFASVTDMTTDSDGNVLLSVKPVLVSGSPYSVTAASRTKGNVGGSCRETGPCAFIIKYSPAGNVLWQDFSVLIVRLISGSHKSNFGIQRVAPLI
jgi:hypothetical protein